MSDDTESNHRTPLSSSSSTPSGTRALSVTIEAEPAPKPKPAAPVSHIGAVSPFAVDDEPLGGEPTEAVITASAAPDETPPASYDESVPLEGEPSTPVIAEVEQAEAVAPLAEVAAAEPDVVEAEPIDAEITEELGFDPIAASDIDEAGAEPVAAAEIAEEVVPEPVAVVEIAAADFVAEAAPADEAEIFQDNIPDAVSEALPDEPADEAPSEPEIARLVLVPHEPDAETLKLRAAVRETLAQNEAKQDRVLQVFGQASAHLKTALDEAGQDAARITFKLMEFAQANVRNNLEFAREYVAVRSVPDMFDLQAAYFKRQMALMNAQAEEFRKLTAELTAKAAAPVNSEIQILTGR